MEMGLSGRLATAANSPGAKLTPVRLNKMERAGAKLELQLINGCKVNNLDFRITPEAVAYIRGTLLHDKTGEAMVFAIAPMGPAQTLDISLDQIKSLSSEDLYRLATEQVSAIPKPVMFEWVVGGTRRDRLPPEDLRIIDGIECFVPDEVRAVVNGRVLRLEEGELRFLPPLELD